MLWMQAREAQDRLDEQRNLVRDLTTVLEKRNDEIKRLSEALTEANDMLRSAYQVAKRDGAETGWEAFRTRLAAVLKKQHAIMYPKEESAAL